MAKHFGCNAETRICPRCRKKFLVNSESEVFHQSCKVTTWKAVW